MMAQEKNVATTAGAATRAAGSVSGLGVDHTGLACALPGRSWQRGMLLGDDLYIKQAYRGSMKRAIPTRYVCFFPFPKQISCKEKREVL
jgi:hypothetical protein